MCGIAGIFGEPDETLLRRAAERLRHRGPDGDGVWIDPQGRAGLAHARLAVIDLPGGGQPIFNEDRSVAVVFNGEIYNYVELRAELLERGHRFATQTDTEALVHLYEERGEDLVERLRGMFAFALWDASAEKLLLARDRLGVKPLYYAKRDGRLLFASEIKGLLALDPGTGDIDDQALSDYLTFGHVPAPRTIYRDVRTLQPGCRIVCDRPGQAEERRYWRLPTEPEPCRDVREAVARVEPLLEEAVRIRLRADVPVGVFLSGGIDSGLVVALASRHLGRPLTTLSVGFEDAAFDERPLARQVAERYGTDHHELLVRPDPRSVLPRIVEAYDQPYADSSAIPTYCLAEATRSHLKVVLTGDGGDEALAGYRRYVAARMLDRMGVLAGKAAAPGWRLLDAVLPGARGFRTRYAFARRLVRGLALPEAQRVLAWGNDGLDEGEKTALAGGSGDWLRGCRPTWRSIDERLAEVGDGARSALDRQLWVDARTLLPDDLLVKMDIATMAHGLEARSPLLDHVFFESAARLPGAVKLAGTETKPVLRALAERHLPAEVAAAPKRGFEVPLSRWLTHELRGLRDEVLLSPSGLLAERFDRGALTRLVENRRGLDPARWSRRVWTLLMLGLWGEARA